MCETHPLKDSQHCNNGKLFPDKEDNTDFNHSEGGYSIPIPSHTKS